MQFHTLVCDKRNEVSSDDDEEVFDDNHSEVISCIKKVRNWQP